MLRWHRENFSIPSWIGRSQLGRPNKTKKGRPTTGQGCFPLPFPSSLYVFVFFFFIFGAKFLPFLQKTEQTTASSNGKARQGEKNYVLVGPTAEAGGVLSEHMAL